MTLLSLHQLAELLELRLALRRQVEAPTDGKQSQWQECRDHLGIVLGLTRCAVLRLALVLQLLPTHLGEEIIAERERIQFSLYLFRSSLAMRLSDVFKLDVAFWFPGLLLPMISHPRQEADTCADHK